MESHKDEPIDKLVPGEEYTRTQLEQFFGTNIEEDQRIIVVDQAQPSERLLELNDKAVELWEAQNPNAEEPVYNGDIADMLNEEEKKEFLTLAVKDMGLSYVISGQFATLEELKELDIV